MKNDEKNIFSSPQVIEETQIGVYILYENRRKKILSRHMRYVCSPEFLSFYIKY